MKTWERRKYEAPSKATTDNEIESIRYDKNAHNYAMMGAEWITNEWRRFHDFVDSLMRDVLDLRGDNPEMNISEKMDYRSYYSTMGYKFETIKKIIQQAFSVVGPSRTRWERYYRNEACDHLCPSGRTGRPQMMIDGKWQDLKEIKDENGDPSVWVRDNDNGGNDENQNAQQG